ncbi:MAG TPA: hypothetical protein VMV08_03975 [Gaiellaceae bacterium]|nr:hypothetical protein [Gaiellaceae bacterium]
MAAAEAAAPSEPKVTELGMLSIGLVAAGVIYLAASLPRRAALGPAVALLAAAAAVLALNVLLLARRPGFAWWRFRLVAGWMLLVYVVISGMIEYAFVYDKTRGAVLLVMTLLLAIFTLNVPLIAAFTVARFERESAQ